MKKRLLFRVSLIIILATVGFIYLLRSCLSKFDERAAVGAGSGSQSGSQFLLFEKEGKEVVFSLIKYQKVISYKRSGGMTQKSVRNSFYVQANDLFTADKIAIEKIKNSSDGKLYSVELLGAAAGKAWLYAGELMAYDPFTLKKEVNISIIEEKNPRLKGKLINEKRYYQFDVENGVILITAGDGAKYELNTTTLIATLIDEENSESNRDEKQKILLDKTVDNVREQRKLAFDRFREYNSLYKEKLLPFQQYQDSSKIVQAEIKTIDDRLDSLAKIQRELRDKKSKANDVSRDIERRKRGKSFSAMKVNTDTISGNWYGLFTPNEMQKQNGEFEYKSVFEETARNKFLKADLFSKKEKWMIGEEKQSLGNHIYLQGGFLLDKQSGFPVRLADGFLVVHKNIIGQKGVLQLTRINFNGDQLWNINTNLAELNDWQLTGSKKLVIVGRDNDELTSGEANLLLIIDLQTGKQVAYDYFTDKVRKL